MVELKINFAKTFSVSILKVEFDILQRSVKIEIAVRLISYAFTTNLNKVKWAEN
jgi:hypothetical protein